MNLNPLSFVTAQAARLEENRLVEKERGDRNTEREVGIPGVINSSKLFTGWLETHVGYQFM